MRGLCILLFFALSACSSWQDIPDDVRFVAFHYGTGPYKTNAWLEFIDVEVETNTNYINYIKEGSDVYVRFYFCGDDYSDEYVYGHGPGGLGLYRYNDKWESVGTVAHDESPPPYRFHTGIAVAMRDGKSKKYDFDLRENPRDLCFYFDSGSYYHERSNVARIPKEELIKFFAEHPRPPAGQ